MFHRCISQRTPPLEENEPVLPIKREDRGVRLELPPSPPTKTPTFLTQLHRAHADFNGPRLERFISRIHHVWHFILHNCWKKKEIRSQIVWLQSTSSIVFENTVILHPLRRVSARDVTAAAAVELPNGCMRAWRTNYLSLLRMSSLTDLPQHTTRRRTPFKQITLCTYSQKTHSFLLKKNSQFLVQNRDVVRQSLIPPLLFPASEAEVKTRELRVRDYYSFGE